MSSEQYELGTAGYTMKQVQKKSEQRKLQQKQQAISLHVNPGQAPKTQPAKAQMNN